MDDAIWILAIIALVCFTIFWMIKTKTYKTAVLFLLISIAIPIGWVGTICGGVGTDEACNGHITWLPAYLAVGLLMGCLFYLVLAVFVVFYRWIKLRSQRD